MNKILIVVTAAIFATVASCSKCATCVPYYKGTNSKDSTAQYIRACGKTNIDAYTSGMNYTNAYGDSIVFKCN